jgi:glycosyltransferase involved in cell wall biosynthesis
MKLPISVIVHTRNSGSTLEKALASVSFGQEIVVIDMESSDNSVHIAKNHGAKIFTHRDEGFVEPARMFGISKASNEWVLVLDADEEVQPQLAQKISQLIQRDESAWKIPRKNLMFGVWPKHTSWWPDYVVRLFKKDAIDWPKTIHAQPQVKGKVGELEALEELAIIHHNYTSVAAYVDRINQYTSIASKEKTNESSNALKSFVSEFLNKYFNLGGHKDGVLGLHVSLLQAIYESVLTMKVWESSGKKKLPINPESMVRSLIQDLAYWRADYNIKHSGGLMKLAWIVRRKLKV